MIIPSLVLVSAMQFADPQSGAKIEDLSSVSWRETPVATSPVTPTAPPNPVQQPVLPAIATSPAPQTYLQASGLLTQQTTNAPDPDADGIPQGKMLPQNVSPPPGDVPEPVTSDSTSSTSNSTVTQTRPANMPQTAPFRSNANGYARSSGMSGNAFSTDAFAGSGEKTRMIVENGVARLQRAVTEFDKVSMLSAPVGGIVVRLQTPKYDEKGMLVKRSDGEPVWLDLVKGITLFKGQEIALLDSRYATQQLNAANTKLTVAKKEAVKDIDIRYAREKLKTAQATLQRSLDINARTPNVIPDADIDIQRLQVTEATLQVEKSISDQETRQSEVMIQEAEVSVAATQLDLRRIKAPYGSMVTDVKAQEGDYLREGGEIAKIAQLDKLKVKSNIDGTQLTQEQIAGKRVTIMATNPDGHTEDFDGFVRFASPTFNSMREFQIEIEVTNRQQNGSWVLKDGDFVDVVIHL
ncbi:MAG: HlyD family efflux transporter periplasmic adaptor subunit [Planctomycetaceae bacterium]|nr:HlyD family efflux transporter periplasmic adaptor subunit [Planctomycetaceae bacterium]